MNTKRLSIAMMVAGVLLVASTGVARSQKDKDKPAAPDEKVIAAWKKAGADFGWIGVDDKGVMVFRAKAEAGDLPAFKFKSFKAGVVGKAEAFP